MSEKSLPQSNKHPIPSTMMAVVTTGNGGYDKLEYKRVPLPQLRTGEVLLKVLAAGMNNTEINTRVGWYSKSVISSTEVLSETQTKSLGNKSDGGWNKTTPFPIIQGTDCCGEVVAFGSDGYEHLVGSRVLVRACIRSAGFQSLDNIWMASDFDGAFAEYVKVPISEIFPVICDWTDAELATIPCAYGTAENMLHRSGCKSGDHVVITGASGGVGSAAIQLAKRRGARVTAITSIAKVDAVRSVGADQVITNTNDLLAANGDGFFDIAVDNVAGEGFPKILQLLKRGGVYASSGAIAGPIVSLDLRDMYLKDITIIGTTAWDEPIFQHLISYIEKGEIRPLLAKTFPLCDIVLAQKAFLKKEHVGNFALLPGH